jgi:hypothetical protein
MRDGFTLVVKKISGKKIKLEVEGKIKRTLRSSVKKLGSAQSSMASEIGMGSTIFTRTRGRARKSKNSNNFQ